MRDITIEQDIILSCYGEEDSLSQFYENKEFFSWKYENLSREDLLNKYSLKEIEELYYQQFDNSDIYKL